MSIHIIPDNCMVNIFVRVPLRSRIGAGQVCSRWRWLRSVATSLAAAKLRSLTILVGANASKLIKSSKFGPDVLCEYLLNDDGSHMRVPKEFSKWNSLKLKSLAISQSRRISMAALIGLACMFPNIVTLKIALNEVKFTELLDVTILLSLLHLGGPKLATLKIYFKAKKQEIVLATIPQFVSDDLFSAINSFSSLRHLTLEFDCNFAFSTDFNERFPDYDATLETTSVDLPIISQLDEFNFCSTDDERGDVMFGSFQRYLKLTPKPLRLQFGVEEFDELSKLALKLNPQICSRFTNLLSCDSYTPISPIEHPTLFLVCTHFTSITRIWVQVEQITMCNFIKTIAKLTNLVHLIMSVWFCDILPDELPGEIYCQLPSVKTVEIAYRISNHHNLSQFNLPWTFPNVQVISIRIFEDSQCDTCDYDLEENAVALNRLKECFKHILSQIHTHLSKCLHLHTIADLIIEDLKASLDAPIFKKEQFFQILELAD